MSKDDFYCGACGKFKPVEQLSAKITGRKKCISCNDKARKNAIKKPHKAANGKSVYTDKKITHFITAVINE